MRGVKLGHMKRVLLLLGLLMLGGCQRPSPAVQIIAVEKSGVSTSGESTPLPPATAASPLATATLEPIRPPTSQPTSTTLSPGSASLSCGRILPIGTPQEVSAEPLESSATAVEALREITPAEAWPAIEHILAHPEQVGLAVYQLGDEANGAFLNANRPAPIASVVKIIILVAYAEAVDSGELNPLAPVLLETLEQYYLPNFDLGAHPRALRELAENGRLLNNETAVSLEDVAWMMMRHSSNAAADYLHRLLGQSRIEETARWLGLTSQTAPCTFLGQFLAMSNHTRRQTDFAAITAYIENPLHYGQEVEQLADAYIENAAFRQAERQYRQQTRRPSAESQRQFSQSLAAQATPRDYANLMARLAQNGLSSGESSFTARRILEWPMIFESNQEQYTNLGYKNGALPGILTTVYYAYRPNDDAPIVIALFFQDMPTSTYRQWRRTLADDELARWLLADPAAIPALRAVINP